MCRGTISHGGYYCWQQEKYQSQIDQGHGFFANTFPFLHGNSADSAEHDHESQMDGPAWKIEFSHKSRAHSIEEEPGVPDGSGRGG